MVEVSDVNRDSANEPWRYVVSNDEHSTLVSREPGPPGWIESGVVVEIRVWPPETDVSVSCGFGGDATRKLELDVTVGELEAWRRTLIKILNRIEGPDRPKKRKARRLE